VILVDTSVLIPFLRGSDTAATRYLARALGEKIETFLAPIIVQEVLQGARDEKEWRALDAYLSTQTLVHPGDVLTLHRHAARIYFDCRRRGLTVRRTIDCLIAQLALDHDLALLHDDRDYNTIGQVRPLKTLP
jgi:hypothetical protein